MAKKARKAKARKKSAKKAARKTTRKVKAHKVAARKRKSAKKAVRAVRARKVAKKAGARAGNNLVAAAAPRPAPAPPAVNEDKVLAVDDCVNSYMDAHHQGWSDTDKVAARFGYTSVSIVGVLTTVRACLKPNYDFRIAPNFPAKCVSANETIRQMKIDITNATI